MISKYQHYNPTKETSDLVNLLTVFFTILNMQELKKSRKKSEFIQKEAITYFNKCGITGEVVSEVLFIENKRDCIDIEMMIDGKRVIVEIDNLRADQVVKKVLSRTSAFPDENLIYVTLCYDSDSAKGHKDECLKYMQVHFRNFFNINNNIEYMAFVPTKYI